MYLDDLTDRMTATVGEDYGKSVRLMIECLQLIPFHMPHVASIGLGVANRYWIKHSLLDSELEKARVDCWNYADERSESTDTETPEDFAVRAVICVLYEAPPEEGIDEAISFFNEMLRGALNEKSNQAFVKSINYIIDVFSRNEQSLPE